MLQVQKLGTNTEIEKGTVYIILISNCETHIILR
jgi:hypothetical protein